MKGRRNPMARQLQDPRYRQRIVREKRSYDAFLKAMHDALDELEASERQVTEAAVEEED